MMTEASTIDLAASPGPSHGTLLRRRVLAHKGLMIGGAVLAVIVIGALLAPWLAPEDPFAQDLTRRLIPPVWHEKGSWAHAFGTDNLGRDYLSRLIFGARISLLIGVSVMVISGLIGTALGLAAGYLGGRTDMAAMFIITVRLALPLILVALAVVATIGERRGRFVEQHDLRFDHQRTRNRDALALAARQFARIDIRIARWQPDAIEQE
jgi:peptide/nickel transport system permease protein